MRRVSIRDLRQSASVWLRQVQDGATFEITDQGRPVALLVPLPQGGDREQLIARGQLRPGKGNLLELGAALRPQVGVPLPSETLERLRADER